jgi:putative peptidoglycan lipid II flippase
MLSSFGSGLLALVRIKYVNSLFGAGAAQDAYRAAFTLPDLLNYFLIGGAASISLITILNRYREAGDEEGADRALSVILTTMLVVLGAGVLLAEIFAPSTSGSPTKASAPTRSAPRSAPRSPASSCPRSSSSSSAA